MPPAEALTPSTADFAFGALDFESVRGLFERLASTSLGRRTVRELAPRTPDGARAALARVRELQALVEMRLAPSFAGVTDPLPAFGEAHRFNRPFEREEFASLSAFLAALARLETWFAERKSDAPAIHALAEGVPDFAVLRGELERALDERGEIKDDASPKLATLRREIRNLSGEIEARLRRIAIAAREHLSDGSIHRRGHRLVLAVKAKSQGKVSGLVHDRSQSGETVFVEPREVIEDQNRRAERIADEEHELRRILVDLTRHALAAEGAVRLASARVGELELAALSAAFATKYGARAIDVAGDEGRSPGLVLRAARHPLLVERALNGALDEVVPIDVRLGDEFDLLVITGPNTGGKTLALKTVGLAACFQRLGLPFPCAEQSRVPLYDGVVADIGDEQGIAQDLSTFSSHLARVRAGLERAGPGTLFLLDELGAGTDPDEGAALSDALLEYLLARRAPTVATTHLGKLKEFAYRHARAENASDRKSTRLNSSHRYISRMPSSA
jgi:DNA mismatch repair protein MutS2